MNSLLLFTLFTALLSTEPRIYIDQHSEWHVQAQQRINSALQVMRLNHLNGLTEIGLTIKRIEREITLSEIVFAG